MTKRKLLRIEKEEFFTESELAKLLRCSRSGLQKSRYNGRGLPYVKWGRSVLYPKSEVQKFIDQCMVVPGGN